MDRPPRTGVQCLSLEDLKSPWMWHLRTRVGVALAMLGMIGLGLGGFSNLNDSVLP